MSDPFVNATNEQKSYRLIPASYEPKFAALRAAVQALDAPSVTDLPAMEQVIREKAVIAAARDIVKEQP